MRVGGRTDQAGTCTAARRGTAKRDEGQRTAWGTPSGGPPRRRSPQPSMSGDIRPQRRRQNHPQPEWAPLSMASSGLARGLVLAISSWAVGVVIASVKSRVEAGSSATLLAL